MNVSLNALRRLRRIGQFSLLLALLATLALYALPLLFSPIEDADYAATLSQLAHLQRSLNLAVLAGALVLVALAAISTWAIALYSSFRVAGPLFRLARNLDALIADRDAELLPLRKGDRLQQEAAALLAAQHALQAHYAALQHALERTRIASSAADAGTESQEPLAALRQLLTHVRS